MVAIKSGKKSIIRDGTLPDAAHQVTEGSLRFMENRDPRFYQTFAFNGLKYIYIILRNWNK